MAEGQAYELVRDIDHYLEALCKLFKLEKKPDHAAIIANAEVKVDEQYSYDRWDGGITGHAMHLRIPEVLFFRIVHSKDEVQREIRDKINTLHNVRGEFIEEVFIELATNGDPKWRSETGLLLTPKKNIDKSDLLRVWGCTGFRVFLSHKSEYKSETAVLKEFLAQFGAVCFVAHEDIEPTREWQNEIENALATMDAFVALLTSDFHNSQWTDQEIGVAIGRDKPIIPVNLGTNPYGFIAKYQAIKCTWDNAGNAILKQLFKNTSMIDSYIQAISDSNSFDASNTLATQLENIDTLSSKQILNIIDAYNTNVDVRNSFSFNGKHPQRYGPGLAHHLTRITKQRFTLDSYGKLSLAY